MKSVSSKKNEKGQGLVEYALILVLVAIVVVGALTVLGPRVGNVFSDINNSIAGTGGGGAAAALVIPPTAVVEPTAVPTISSYQQWCNSLGWPYHMNGSGVCVSGN